MKKYLALLCATMLCACCLGLAACGGSSGSSAASSGSASSASASSAADPAKNFVGDWKFAGAESGGVTMVGDLSGLIGDSMNIGLSVKEDGTGTVSMGEDSSDFTWVVEGDALVATMVRSDSAASASASASAASSEASAGSESAAAAESGDLTEAISTDSGTLKFTYADGVLSASADNDGTVVTIMFTQDGTLPGASVIDASAATPVTDEAKLVGDWNLTGMSMFGMSVYGSSEDVAAMAGGADMSLTLEAGGKGKFAGEDITWSVGADGAALESGGVSMPLTMLGDDLLIDYSGAYGIEMLMLFSK